MTQFMLLRLLRNFRLFSFINIARGMPHKVRLEVRLVAGKNPYCRAFFVIKMSQELIDSYISVQKTDNEPKVQVGVIHL